MSSAVAKLAAASAPPVPGKHPPKLLPKAKTTVTYISPAKPPPPGFGKAAGAVPAGTLVGVKAKAKKAPGVPPKASVPV